MTASVAATDPPLGQRRRPIALAGAFRPVRCR